MVKIAMEGEGPQIAVSVPLFLKKLWKMVNDKEAEDIIGWNSAGDGFVIYDQLQFITKLLPHYFKHNNMASFIRQLNFYDFHKVAGIDKDEIHFSHNCFLKDLPETLIFIKRKCTSTKSKMANNVKEEELMDLLNGVKELKSKHTLVDNELKLLKQENAALWREINNLRVKHSKQTKIINKIIHFLISYMHSQNSLSKRNGPITRKNSQNNIKTGPTILEIDYHNDSSDLPEEPNQDSVYTGPESSGTIIYDVDTQHVSDEQPAVEKSLDEIINTVAISSNQDKVPSKRVTILADIPLRSIEPSKSNTLDESNANMLENLNVSSTIAIPKSAKTLVNPISNANISANLGTGATSSVNPKTETVGNSVATAIANSKPSTLDYSKVPENFGLSFSNTEKPSFPLKNSAQYNTILENPKQNLGLYLDNTQVELNSLQDMLNNLSSAELSTFCNLMETVESDHSDSSTVGDLVNMSHVTRNDQIGNLVNLAGDSNEGTTKDTLPEEYAVLPMDSNTLDEVPTENNNFGSEQLTAENVMPEVLVDEYFNTEF